MSAPTDSVGATRAARWPTLVLTLSVAGILLADLMTLVTWRAGYAAPYEYWREATLGPVAYGVVGWTIAMRIPGNCLGPVMLAGMATSAVQDLFGNLAVIGYHDGWPPDSVAALAGSFRAAQAVSVGLIVAVLLLVPDGRTLSRFFHRALVTLAVGVGLSATAEAAIGTSSESLKGVPSGASLASETVMSVAEVVDTIGMILIATVLAVAMVGIILRWRRSKGEARRRVTWVVMGGLAGPLLVAVLIVIPSSWPWWTHDGSAVWAVAGVMLPLGIAVAVLRHGLYELDSVVSRTVSYAIVTGGVLLVYVAVVAGVSQLAPASDNIAVAAATLAAAATARPLLRRVRDRVDKQFNRARFDHAVSVAGFSAQMQSTVDPARVQRQLVDVLGRTLQPRALTVWVRADA